MGEASALLHPEATGHLPLFITRPGETDVLFNVTLVFLVLMIFGAGLLYLKLHALPEHMAHGASKTQIQLVGVLALLALFTHNHIFWIAALLLALIQFPDFSTPIGSMARSLERLADRDPSVPAPALVPPAVVERPSAASVEAAGDEQPEPATAAHGRERRA
jgi:uncharacterized protein YhhL (DUF1145 family)